MEYLEKDERILAGLRRLTHFIALCIVIVFLFFFLLFIFKLTSKTIQLIKDIDFFFHPVLMDQKSISK